MNNTCQYPCHTYGNEVVYMQFCNTRQVYKVSKSEASYSACKEGRGKDPTITSGPQCQSSSDGLDNNNQTGNNEQYPGIVLEVA